MAAPVFTAWRQRSQKQNHGIRNAPAGAVGVYILSELMKSSNDRYRIRSKEDDDRKWEDYSNEIMKSI